MKTRYTAGKRLVAYGQVSAFGAQKEMIHPDVEFVEADDDSAILLTSLWKREEPLILKA